MHLEVFDCSDISFSLFSEPCVRVLSTIREGVNIHAEGDVTVKT